MSFQAPCSKGSSTMWLNKRKKRMFKNNLKNSKIKKNSFKFQLNIMLTLLLLSNLRFTKEERNIIRNKLRKKSKNWNNKRKIWLKVKSKNLKFYIE